MREESKARLSEATLEFDQKNAKLKRIRALSDMLDKASERFKQLQSGDVFILSFDEKKAASTFIELAGMGSEKKDIPDVELLNLANKAKATYLHPENKEGLEYQVSRLGQGVGGIEESINAFPVNYGKDFETTLPEIARLKEQLEMHDKRVAEAQNQIEEVRKQIRDAQAKFAQAQMEVATTEEQVVRLEGQSADAKKQVTVAERKVDDHLDRVRAVSEQVEKVRSRVATAEGEVEKVRSEIAAAERQVAEARSEIADAERRVAEIEHQVNKDRGKRQELEAELAKAKADADEFEIIVPHAMPVLHDVADAEHNLGVDVRHFDDRAKNQATRIERVADAIVNEIAERHRIHGEFNDLDFELVLGSFAPTIEIESSSSMDLPRPKSGIDIGHVIGGQKLEFTLQPSEFRGVLPEIGKAVEAKLQARLDKYWENRVRNYVEHAIFEENTPVQKIWTEVGNMLEQDYLDVRLGDLEKKIQSLFKEIDKQVHKVYDKLGRHSERWGEIYVNPYREVLLQVITFASSANKIIMDYLKNRTPDEFDSGAHLRISEQCEQRQISYDRQLVQLAGKFNPNVGSSIPLIDRKQMQIPGLNVSTKDLASILSNLGLHGWQHRKIRKSLDAIAQKANASHPIKLADVLEAITRPTWTWQTTKTTARQLFQGGAITKELHDEIQKFADAKRNYVVEGDALAALEPHREETSGFGQSPSSFAGEVNPIAPPPEQQVQEAVDPLTVV
jgi:peptidoglycan hydrolase CwlO-like protein